MKTIKLIIGITLLITVCNTILAVCEPIYTYTWEKSYVDKPLGDLTYNAFQTFKAMGKWERELVSTGTKTKVNFIAKESDNNDKIRWKSSSIANVTVCEEGLLKPTFKTKFKKPGESGRSDPYNTSIAPTDGGREQDYRAEDNTLETDVTTPGVTVKIVT